MGQLHSPAVFGTNFHLVRRGFRLGDRHHPYVLHCCVRVTNYIGRINRVRSWLTDPPDLRICMAFPHSASVHNITERSLRWNTVQIPTQFTTIMSCCLQGYCEYGRILPCLPSRFFELSSVVCQAARLSIDNASTRPNLDVRRSAGTSRATFRASPSKWESSCNAAV